MTDRYIASSLAYQGFGRELDVAAVRRLNDWATGGLWPDITVLVDVPPDVAQARLGAERDRLEAEGAGFHDRVVAGYRELAAAGPERWVVVDGIGSVDTVAARVRAALEAALERPLVSPAWAPLPWSAGADRLRRRRAATRARRPRATTRRRRSPTWPTPSLAELATIAPC